jgi:hypothetical protein
MELTGFIVDAMDKKPLPGATVELWYGNVMLSRAIADTNGYFSISSASSPTVVTVTSASYKAASFNYKPATGSITLSLERNVVEGEPVIIKSIIEKKGGWLVLVGLALFFLLSKKRTT